jgi:hypothetical protein
MSSRDYNKLLVSNTAPTIIKVGDEYFDPGSNKLYKSVVVNGTTVSYVEITTSLSGILGGLPTYSSVLSSRVLAGASITIPGNLSYTLGGNLDVFVDGIKWIRGVDYYESTPTTIITNLSIPIGSTIEYRAIR